MTGADTITQSTRAKPPSTAKYAHYLTKANAAAVFWTPPTPFARVIAMTPITPLLPKHAKPAFYGAKPRSLTDVLRAKLRSQATILQPVPTRPAAVTPAVSTATLLRGTF